MELNQFIQIGLPVSLALIMLSLGLTIQWPDITRQLSQPRSTLVGLSAQLLLVPLLALGIIKIFQLPPALATGLMILSFCPGGVTSNWFSHMANANVPLSISLTVIASLITPFTIPALSELALQNFMGDSREVHIPLGLTMMRLFIVSVIPVAIGITIRARFEVFSRHWQPLIYRVATSLFLGVIAGIIFQQWTRLPGLLAQSGMASLCMILAGMALGILIARIARLDQKDTRTIAIEVGMQNAGMALVVTQNVLHSAELSIVPVIYGLIMLIPIFLYSRYARTQPI
jgi:BASS family bile acid:Na+ symporter